jgi:hypothetical protein
MAHFIELHQNDKDNTPILLNVDWILNVGSNVHGSTINFAIEKFRGTDSYAGTQSLEVSESYSTIKEFLGC